MPAIMADHDTEGQVQILLHLLTSAEWHALWHELAIRVESFTSLGIPADISDAELWQVCQTRQAVGGVWLVCSRRTQGQMSPGPRRHDYGRECDGEDNTWCGRIGSR